jgi:hypothetical protein
LTSAVADYYKNIGGQWKHIGQDNVFRTFYPVTGNQLTNRQEQWRVDGIIPMEVAIVAEDASKNSIVVKDADGLEISRQQLTPGQNNIFIDKPEGAKVYLEMVTGSPVSVASMKVDGETVVLDSGVDQPSHFTTGAKTVTRDITEAVNAAASVNLHLQGYSETRFAYNDKNELREQTDLTGGKFEGNIETRVKIQSGIDSGSPLVTSASFNGLLTDTGKLIAVTAEPASGASSHPDYASLLIDKGMPQDGSGKAGHYEYVDNRYSYYAIEVKTSEVSTSWPFAGLTIETSAFTNFKENVLTVNRTVLGYENVYNIGLGPFRYDLTGVEVDRETGADISGGKLNGLERINGGECITISDDKGTIGYFDSALQYHTYVSGVGDVTVNLAGQISTGRYVYMPQLTIERTNLEKHGNDATNLPGGAEEWTGEAILDIIGGNTYFNIQDNNLANYGGVETMLGDSKNTQYTQFAYRGTEYLSDNAAALYFRASAILTQTQAVKDLMPWLFGTGYADASLGYGWDDGDLEAYCRVEAITGGKDYSFSTNKNTGFSLSGYDNADPSRGTLQMFAEKQGNSAQRTIYFVRPYSLGQFDLQKTLAAAEELGLNFVDGTSLQDNPLFQFVAGMMPGGIYPTTVESHYTNSELAAPKFHTSLNPQTGEAEIRHYTNGGNVITNLTGDVISATVPVKNSDGSSSLTVWRNPEYPGYQQQQNIDSVGSSPASQWLAKQLQGEDLAGTPISPSDISGLTPVEPGTVPSGSNPSDQYNVIKAGFNPVESLSDLYGWAIDTWVGQQLTGLVYSEKTETDGRTTTVTGSLFNIIPWNSETTYFDPEAEITEITSSYALGLDKFYSYSNGLTGVSYSKKESYFGLSSSEDFKSPEVNLNIQSMGIGGIGVGSGSFNGVPVIFQKSLNGEKLTPPYANADQVAIQLNRGTSEEGGNSWEIREYNKNGELQEAFSYDFGGRFSSSNSLIYSGMQKTSGDEGTDIYSAGVSKTEQTGSKVTRSSGSGSVGIKDDNFVQPVSSNIAFNNKVCISGILREETNSNEIYSGLSYKDQDSYLPSGGYKSVSTQYVQSSLNPSLVGKTESVSAGFTQTLTSAGQIAVQTLTNWHYTLADTATGVKTIDRSADKVVNSYNYPDKKTVVNNYQNTGIQDHLSGTSVQHSEGTSTIIYDDLGRRELSREVTGPVAVQDSSSAGSPVISYGTRDNTDTYSYNGDGNDVYQHGYIYNDCDYINMEVTSTEGNEKFNAYNAAGSVSDKNSLQDTKVYGLNDDYSADLSDLRLWTGEASHEWNIAQNGNVRLDGL